MMYIILLLYENISFFPLMCVELVEKNSMCFPWGERLVKVNRESGETFWAHQGIDQTNAWKAKFIIIPHATDMGTEECSRIMLFSRKSSRRNSPTALLCPKLLCQHQTIVGKKATEVAIHWLKIFQNLFGRKCN